MVELKILANLHSRAFTQRLKAKGPIENSHPYEDCKITRVRSKHHEGGTPSSHAEAGLSRGSIRPALARCPSDPGRHRQHCTRGSQDAMGQSRRNRIGCVAFLGVWLDSLISGSIVLIVSESIGGSVECPPNDRFDDGG